MSQDQKIWELFINRLDLFTFEMCLQKYVDIVNPLARSLWSLESLQANAADVYIFWIAIIATLKDLFSQNKKQTFIGKVLARKVTAIINTRYKAFIDNSPTDIYFTAFFLDPRMRTHFVSSWN